jgi:hypothetical protein
MKLIITSACALLCAQSVAASDKSVNWVPADGQTIRYFHGREAVESHLPSSSVRLFEPDGLVDDRGTFEIFVLNYSYNELYFGPELISVTASDGEIIPILNHSEMLAQKKRRHRLQGIIGGIGSALVVGGSGHIYDEGNVNFSGSTIDGHRFSGTGTVRIKNEAASRADAERAQAFVKQNQEEFERKKQREIAAIGAAVQPIKLLPKKQAGGNFTIELPSKYRRGGQTSDITVRVQVGDEKHQFVARLSDSEID